jgi:methylase of polypeptide subunit release factors
VDIDVRSSDLFAGIDPERFDLICFNIPFYPKPATTPFELALNAGNNFETVRRFARDAHGWLVTGGRVVIIFSEDSGYRKVMEIFAEAGWQMAEERRRWKNFELFHIVEFMA